MTPKPISEMKSLGDQLAAVFSDVEFELNEFPSGNAMLDIRRAGRAFVMSYSAVNGFGVDELRPDDGFLPGYQFAFQGFVPAAEKLRELVVGNTKAIHADFGSPAQPAVSLIVLQSGNVDATKDFYSAIGLTFVEEQHGGGPRHFAAILGRLVLEIYPCREKPVAPLRIGLDVPKLDQTIETLRSRGARIVREAKDSPWGRRAVVEDPDGNRVELAMVS